MIERRNILILVSAILLISGCSQFGAEKNVSNKTLSQVEKPLDRLVFRAKVEVISSSPPHIVSSKTVLDFGKLPYNMVERKEVLITNNRNFAVMVIPSANGSISRWLTFDKEQIIIEPKGKNSSLVTIKVTKDADPGNYSGYVVYTIYKLS